MIKLVRNAFAKLVLYDSTGGRIRWDYIKSLVDYQVKNELHPATKLRRKHLNWEDQKNEGKTCHANSKQ